MSSAGVRSRPVSGAGGLTARWRSSSPYPDGTPASAEFVRRCLGVLAEQGFQRVITSAVSPPEQAGLLQAGFEVHEHLHLLLLPRRAELPPVPAVPRRPPRRPRAPGRLVEGRRSRLRSFLAS